MAKQNNIMITKALLRDMLTMASKLHKHTQAANQAYKDDDIATMQEHIAEFQPLTKELAAISATIKEHASAE